MNRLSAVIADEKVIVDGEARDVAGLAADYPAIHAVQHANGSTEVEWRDGRPNSPPDDSALVDALRQRWVDAEPRTVYHKETSEELEITVSDPIPGGYQETEPTFTTVYDAETGEPLEINELDPIPEGYQANKPQWLLVEEAHERAFRRAVRGYEGALGDMIAQYPAIEREGWAQQEREARKIDQGGSSAMIQTMADKRGIPAYEMAQRIIVKADAYAILYAEATAQLHLLEADIEAAVAAEDVSALDAIDWPAA